MAGRPQIVFSHVWLLLIRASSIAHDSVQAVLPAPFFASIVETCLRFLLLATRRSWKEFLYVTCGCLDFYLAVCDSTRSVGYF